MNLNPNHPSIDAMTTIHPKLVLHQKNELFIRGGEKIVKQAIFPLKSGINNKKLCGENGRKIPYTIKGRWMNMPIYSLTLVERETCPTYCKFIRLCYGNDMMLAHRYQITNEVLDLIEDQLQFLNRTNKSGFLVRLHVLGDFDTPEYAAFWNMCLTSYKRLHIWGYTARLRFSSLDERYNSNDSKIFKIVESMNLNHSDRCFIRFSGYEDNPEKVNYRIALSESEPLAQELLDKKKAIVCPYQVKDKKTGQRLTSSCSSCGLCWSNNFNKAIVWKEKKGLY
jgi:hypothetical protein